MKETLAVLFSLLLIAFIGLLVLRRKDRRHVQLLQLSLKSRGSNRDGAFDRSLIEILPEPAQRYFEFAIQPGTPLRSAAEITMHGQLNLGTASAPRQVPMQATELLYAPHGFIWDVTTHGNMPMSGYDGAIDYRSWSRFWLYGLVPIARAGVDHNHLRSAFARYVAEAVFWTPAAVLPSRQVMWEPIDARSARMTFAHMELEQSVVINVADDGRLESVHMQRWSNANTAKTYQLQPFGGYLSEYQSFGGYRLPTKVVAGNFFGTDAYFAFFTANVETIHFL